MKAALLDALGTLVELERPWPYLVAELRARGVAVSEEEARRAMLAEMAYYKRHHDDARDFAGLKDLRRRCAGIVRAELGTALPVGDVEDAMLAAIRFRPYPEVPGVLAALGGRGGAVASDEDRLDAGRPRAGDVGVEVVARVDGLVRLRACELERAREDRRVGLRRAELGGRHDGVDERAQARALEHVVQRDVPVADDHDRGAALAQCREHAGHLGVRAEADCGEHGVLDLLDRQRDLELGPHDPGAAAAQVLQAGDVLRVVMVGLVVGHLREHRPPGVVLRHRDASGAELGRKVRPGPLELDDRPEGVQQRGPHANQCQVANTALTIARPAAEGARTAARRIRPPSAIHAPSHMNSGNSTARNRGSDMSGCGPTG